MKVNISTLLLSLMLYCFSLNAVSQSSEVDKIAYSEDWKEYQQFDGIKVEYKFAECNNENVRNQVLVLFRFTNTTNEKRSISWMAKVWRNGKCVNADKVDDPEHNYSVTLSPGEVISGTTDSKANKSLYLFSNFIKLVPGMTNSKLTNFEFVNTSVTIL
ncbi:MAG: hypothetical protein WDZ35_00010 [Crocinitomicaceae bacterium]